MIKNKNKLKQDGFTLIELLVTIIVLGIIITSMGGLYYLNQILAVESQHYDLAVAAARTEIENLRNTGYDSLTPGSTINFTSGLPSGLPPSKNGTVVVSQPVSDLRRVDVTVTYKDYGNQQTVKLSSDIGIIGISEGK
ncbi:MAG TPA: prepilin-type N-terminal cleavage/methylation domain-containing protein [Patescibacteria group bacterium]|nr:prepilin-type N-terminal cleavage/methylation domain-containing protein [Patescibacteria group bacterium]